MAGTALVIVVLLVSGTFRLFVWPPTGAPGRADVAAVLSGSWETRLAEGRRLVEEGVVDTLVYAGRPDSPAAEALCDGRTDLAVEVVCLRPAPDTTRTEVRAVAELAERRGWRSVVLVTSTYHVTRAGLMLRRCFEGDVHVVGADLPAGIHLTPRLLLREWAGLARATLFERGC